MSEVAGIILLVDDIDVSTDFYKKLGFKVVKNVPDTAITVSLGTFRVELLSMSNVVTEEYMEDIQNPKKGAGIYLQVQVDDIDTFFEEISGRGIRTTGSPKDFPWSQREFIIFDPDGYKLAFFSPIPGSRS